MMGCTNAPGDKMPLPARAPHKDHTYELVSKVAYLIGVPLRIFENEHEPPQLELYDQLERDKNARIIRNLCIIRTAIERNYKRINDAIRTEYRGLLSMPEFIPSASLQQLSNDGVNFIKKSSTKLCHHVIEINRLISDRINNCKSLFPVWINWAYLKELFLMPDGLTEGTGRRGQHPVQRQEVCGLALPVALRRLYRVQQGFRRRRLCEEQYL